MKIYEGTVAAPQDLKQLKRLEQLLKRPLEASSARDMLMGIIEDDGVSDAIYKIEKKNPKGDVRKYIVIFLKNYLKEMEDPMNPEKLRRDSLDLLRKLAGQRF